VKGRLKGIGSIITFARYPLIHNGATAIIGRSAKKYRRETQIALIIVLLGIDQALGMLPGSMNFMRHATSSGRRFLALYALRSTLTNGTLKKIPMCCRRRAGNAAAESVTRKSPAAR